MWTLLIILVTVAVSVAAWQKSQLLDVLIYWGPGVSRGQWWRMLTHGFIHADGAHLLFNMITLYFFGSVMEQVLVPEVDATGYVAFYLAGIVLASLPNHLRHRHDSNYRSLGASGAVSAVLFAYILLQPWATLYVFFFPVPAVVFAAVYVAYSIQAGRASRDSISHSAHLWGAAWGVGFLIMLEPRVVPAFFRNLLSPPFL